jgi:hypothetical protein
MNWGAFALTAIAIVVWFAALAGTWIVLEWIEAKFGVGVSIVCAVVGFVLCAATLVGLNA